MSVDTYKRIFESSPDLICSFLPDATLTFVNEAFRRALEADRNALPGRPFTELIPEEDTGPFLEKIAALSPEAPSGSYRLLFPLSNGEAYAVHWNIHGSFTPQGELVEVHAFGRDDSERERANELLAKGARREKLAAQIISDYTFCKSRSEFDEITENALELLGKENRADRANLFRFSADIVGKTHEWCAPGVPSLKERMQNLPVHKGSWWVDDIRNNATFYYPDQESLVRRSGETWKHLETLKLHSLAGFPVVAEGRLLGVVSLENVPKGVLSPETDFPLIASISRVIGKTLALLEAEEDLRTAKNMYRDIVEKQSELIVRFAPDRTITFCNHAYARYFGGEPEDFGGRNLESVFSVNFDHLSKLTPESPQSTVEKRIAMPDGSERWHVWHDTGLFDAKGALKEIQAVGWDMTELKTAKQAHENERRRSLALFENSPEAILASWDGIRIAEANRAFYRMTGLSHEDVIGKPLREILFPGTGENSLNIERILDRANSGEPVVEEGALEARSGRLFLSLLLLPVRNKAKSGRGVYLFFRNLTALNEKENQLLTSMKKLHTAFSQTVEVLALAVEGRDPYTAGHQKRTAMLSLAVARRMGLDENTCEGVYLAAAIHDVGKISVPTEILSRPGKLHDIEFALVKTHAEEGYNILKKVDFPWRIAEIVRQHHERLDGSGYPQGLKGHDILLEAKIVGLADTVEAMGSHRPYRPSLGIDAALRFVEEGKGTLFDKDAVDACRRLFAEGFSFEENDTAT
jgi:PAS domain S-box-containing protein/putative nucleotidyltransferase with HDIG domain